MKKYVDKIFKWKKPLFVLFALLNIGALIGITQVKLNTDFTLFTTPDSKYEETLKELENTFGSTNQIVIMVEMDQFDDATKADLRSIQASLENMTDIDYVQGPAPASVTSISGTQPYENLNASTLYQLYQRLEEFSPLKEKDGKVYGLMTVFLTDNFNRQDVNSIESLLGNYSYNTYIAGDMYNQMKVVDYILRILFILPPLTILVILLVFRWQIGAFKPTILSVLPAAFGSLWTFGIIGFLGNEISILTAVIPVFIIVIGSADGLHFMTHYQESIKAGLSKEASMTKTLRVVGIPMIITTLTSMAGFMSLLSINTSSIVDLAIFAALGIFLAGVATWYVLPLILTNNINVVPKKESKFHMAFGASLKKLCGLPSIIVVAVLLVLALIFTGKINHEFDMLSVYKNYTVVKKNAEKLQEVNGGSIPLYIEYKSSDIITVASRDQVAALVSDLEDTGYVNHVINPYRLLDITYQNMIGTTISNDFVMDYVYTTLQDGDLPLDSMFNTDQNVVRIMLFPTDMKNDTLNTLETVVDDSPNDFTITGAQFLLKDLNVSIGTMQLYSILLAIGIVFLMLLISLRDLKLAFFSILPITVTVAAVYAVMGMTGIPLNITTVIIFSISIGVGIDYAVHYSSVYKMHYKETKHALQSVEHAYRDVSKPIIANALGISLGLSVLMFSPLTIHMNVSILMWVSMIISVFVTLTFLPTILRHKKRKL